MNEITTPDGRHIAVGQIWADADWRSQGRTVRIVGIGSKHVYVETVTLTGGVPAPKRKPTRILQKRLRPNSTGYRLINESTS